MKQNPYRTRALRALSALVAAVVFLPTFAQNPQKEKIDLSEFIEIYRDTTEYAAPTTIITARDSIIDPTRVVQNKFNKNWFVFGTLGGHTFRGDYSNYGPFKGTLSPDFTIGIAKWFTPGVGIKLEGAYSDSRGYTGYKSGHYGYGDILTNDAGAEYRLMRTNWWDVHGSVIFNLSRLFMGYEGINNSKMMNQFMFTSGIGLVHHMGYANSHGSDNELSAHTELQYSRFFTRAKRFSLDFKLRGIFYQTNFDLEYGQGDYAAHKIDCNLGAAIGFTFYLGKQRDNGWGHGATKVYQRDYSERSVLVVKQKEVVAPAEIQQGTITFYVFYPNNYSGRNDAPIVAGADVNSIDYLAGGLYTQKRYEDTSAASEKLHTGASLNGLKISDIPTEMATDLTFALDVPRGYEMEATVPMSLSLAAGDMNAFYEKEGFYYAPIYDGRHTWQYRIDDATLGQQLLSDANYAESNTYGLNAHSGLQIIRDNMKLDSDDELVSFADVYAAVNGNEGYISNFADSTTVSRIKDVFDNGIISFIQLEGMATSQDNYSGANATRIGEERNNALSVNRTSSVVMWLQQNENLKDALTQTFIGTGNNVVNTVNDESTRGLNAKLNRGVKVRIHYMKR